MSTRGRTRRDVLKTLAAAGAGSVGGWPVSLEGGAAPPNGPADLAVVHGPDARAAVQAAVDAIGGMRAFVSRGSVVFVKPNIGFARGPGQAANTHPNVVAAVVELCYEAGAKLVKVADHTIDNPARSYQRSGIQAAAAKAGARVEFVDPAHFRQMRVGGQFVKDWPVYPAAVEADTLINVPVAKQHSLCRVTVGMKNWFGMIGERRADLHPRIHTAIVDLARFFRPRLTIVDATRILVRNGPQGGSLADVEQTNLIVASADQVAADAYGATLFGMSAGQVDYIRDAHERGLGSMRLDRLRVVKRTV